MQDAPIQNVTVRRGFFREALGELKRKFQRRQLRSQLRQNEGDRNQALVRLGTRAWQEKVDLSALPELRDRLKALDDKSRELSDTSARLLAEKSELEQKRQGELRAFDNRRRPVDDKKQNADVEWGAASQRLADEDRASKQIEVGLGELSAQLAALEQKTAGGPAAPGRQTTPGPSREQLLAEQVRLSEGLSAAKAAVRARSEEVNRLAGESRRYSDEIATLDSQRQAALAPLDTALSRVGAQLTAGAQEAASVGTQRVERFRQLGLALYDRKTQEPALSQEMGQIAAIGQAGAATNASLEASLALSRAVPRGAMFKFWAVVVLVPCLVIGVGYGLSTLFTSSDQARTNRRSSRTVSLPTISESEKDALVKTLVDSRRNKTHVSNEEARAAVNVLTEDLLDLGATADPQYLPVLVRVLRSDASELRAAAADAIGMIGPTADQTAPLTEALNDPVPAVRLSAAQALRMSRDPSASNLAARSGRGRGGYVADLVPGENDLGVPVYPGAKFLYFASDPGAGRAAFVTTDPNSNVVSFYADKAQRATMTLDQALGTTLAGIADYDNQRFYGNPMIVVLRDTESVGGKSATHFVVVYEDQLLKQTGFVLHFVVRPVPQPAGGPIEQ